MIYYILIPLLVLALAVNLWQMRRDEKRRNGKQH